MLLRALMCFFGALLFACKINAQGLILDSEINQVLKQLSDPLFAAAQVDGADIKIFVIDDANINARASNNSIVVNSGLILFSNDPEPLIGILAHEIAHIAFLHPAKIQSKLASNHLPLVLGSAVGAIMAMATGNADALIMSIAVQDFIHKLFLSYSREQENIADQAALRYLDNAGYSNAGLKAILSYLNTHSPQGHVYDATHPLTSERLRMISNYRVTNSERRKIDRQAFERVVVKLKSFTEPPDAIIRIAFKTKNLSLYAHAIAHYRKNEIKRSLSCVDKLLEQSPSDIYYNELKGGILLKAGRIKDAINYYAKAVASGGDQLIIADHARVMMNGEDRALFKEAVKQLEALRNKQGQRFIFYKDLAKGYFLLDMKAKSYLMLAEEAILAERCNQAREYVYLAKQQNQLGKIDSNRLKDIDAYLLGCSVG